MWAKAKMLNIMTYVKFAELPKVPNSCELLKNIWNYKIPKLLGIILGDYQCPKIQNSKHPRMRGGGSRKFQIPWNYSKIHEHFKMPNDLGTISKLYEIPKFHKS